MANKIFDDYQGTSIKINGVCYYFIGETTSAATSNSGEVEAVFSSCLECALESSSSSSSLDPQSESSSSSSELYSESSSSSFELIADSSSSSQSEISYPSSGCAGGAPGVAITVTFAGGGTKNIWGIDFSSGDTNIICPTNYNCQDGTNTKFEIFQLYSTGGYNLNMMGSVRNTDYGFGDVQVGIGSLYFWFANGNWPLRKRVNFMQYAPPYSSWNGSGASIQNYSNLVYSPALAGNEAAVRASLKANQNILDAWFGSVTTSIGVTISWSRVNPSEWCSPTPLPPLV